MDLNIAATTTTIVNSNQENNQLLLNAIKNKFAAQTATEAAVFSPPKFDIPQLKVPGGSQLEEKSNSQQNTQLNQFLLKQLNEKHTNDGATKGHNGFVLPQLQTMSNNKGAVKFELPILKPQSMTPALATDSKISSLTTAINKLQVQECKTQANIPNTPAIDLSTALASKLQTQQQDTPATRDFVKPTQNNTEEVDFEIPFIDCDRLDVFRKRAILLPISNEYCITDISQLILQHSFVEPSAIGRFVCLDDDKYSAPLPLKYFSAEYHQQQVKHHIVPFQFDTKSPDDVVMEALAKYQRRHLN